MTTKDKKLLACFDDSPSGLVFWAFRYFLGRSAIHTCSFAEDLAKAWPYLDEGIAKLIKRELEEEFERDDEARDGRKGTARHTYLPLGMDCDRAVWELVRGAYRE